MTASTTAGRKPGRPPRTPEEVEMAREFGARLRARRLKLRMTQRQVAGLIDADPGTVRYWDAGCGVPSARHVPGLCRALRTDPNTLFGWEDHP